MMRLSLKILLLLWPSTVIGQQVYLKGNVYTNEVYGYTLPIPPDDGMCMNGASTHGVEFVIKSKNCVEGDKRTHIVVSTTWALPGRTTSEKLADVLCDGGKYEPSNIRVGNDHAIRCSTKEADDTVRYVVFKEAHIGSRDLGISMSILVKGPDGDDVNMDAYIGAIFSNLHMIDR